MKKNYLILTGLFASALAWSSGELCAQNKQLKGRIIDRETGEVLPGATVRTNRGRHTLSDTQGRYSLEADKADTLFVSYVGCSSGYPSSSPTSTGRHTPHPGS